MTSLAPTRQQYAVLMRHFLAHFFKSELIPRQAEARVTLIQILALVATPGFVIMCCLLRKYARLAPLSPEAAYFASLDEKCLFIYFSMVVIGLVAVLEWDTLFPDRRDYLILSPLPISVGSVFLSKAASLCVFVFLFSAFVNAFPAVLYPVFLSRELHRAFWFILSHALSVFAGNVFIFFACIAIQGFLLNVLGPGLFVRASRYVQLTLLVLFLTTFFLMPFVSFVSLKQNPRLLDVFVPAWFLGLYQTLLGGPSGDFLPLAHRALVALGLSGLGFALSYGLAYRRQLRRTLEAGPAGSRKSFRLGAAIFSIIRGLILRNPKERAVFSFIAKTLARSQAHRTYLGAYFGTGLAFVLMGLITLISRHGFKAAFELRQELLSIPLVLGFFVLLGFRVVFALPAHLSANWLFRLTDGNSLSGSLSGVHKAMLLLGTFPLLALLFPVYLSLWGWQVAWLHTAYCTTLSLLLIEVLLFRLDKMPFTCTYAPGKANLKLWWWVYLFGFTNYAYTMTELEQRLLRQPHLFAPFFVVGVGLLLAAAAFRNRLIARLSAFRYEADAVPAPEPLILSYRLR
jgi:hypothetical protein